MNFDQNFCVQPQDYKINTEMFAEAQVFSLFRYEIEKKSENAISFLNLLTSLSLLRVTRSNKRKIKIHKQI